MSTRRKEIIVTAFLAVLFFVNGAVFGTTYYVDPNGSDDANGLSWATAFATVQKGLDSAADFDVVEVNEGTYYENDVDFGGVSCCLRSTDPNDWDVVAATIIDGRNRWNDVIFFDSGEDANAILSGLTISGGDCKNIYCDGTNPVIKNCIIKDGAGMGICCDHSACPTIINNKIGDNSSSGINCENSCSPTITNNWIYSNYYGMYLYSSNPVIRNNTIVGNTDYGIYGGLSSPTISNCIIWGHDDDDLSSGLSATYSCIEDCNDANGTGNICGDANDPNFVDHANDDYHLNAGSPCIDIGDPNGDYTGEYDIDGENRVIDVTGKGDDVNDVDMGADEFNPLTWSEPNVIYVDIDAGSGGDGSCWAKAYDDLQDGLGAASSGDEIWVAEGTYYPDGADPNNRDLRFSLIADTGVYGGFDGNETARSQRDWSENETILSGAIGSAGYGDNSKTVVGGASGATLDGFTVEWGYGVEVIEGQIPSRYGGGLSFQSSASHTAMEVRNCIFENNKDNFGGAIAVKSPYDTFDIIIENCEFNYNYARYEGGAFYTREAEVEISNCFFQSNQAYNTQTSENARQRGGAICLDVYDTSEITNCGFFGNSAPGGYGGAIRINNGSANNANAEIINCVFANNHANLGGAINVYETGEDQKVSIINSTFYGNYAGGTDPGGAGVYHRSDDDPYTSYVEVYNSIFWDNLTSPYASVEIAKYGGNVSAVNLVYYSDVQDWPGGGTGNIDQDPNFVDVTDFDGDDNIWPTSDDGLAIDANSPCIDAADSNDTPTTDILGNSRYDDPNTTDTGVGDPNYYDMGAYEYQG